MDCFASLAMTRGGNLALREAFAFDRLVSPPRVSIPQARQSLYMTGLSKCHWARTPKIRIPRVRPGLRLAMPMRWTMPMRHSTWPSTVTCCSRCRTRSGPRPCIGARWWSSAPWPSTPPSPPRSKTVFPVQDRSESSARVARMVATSHCSPPSGTMLDSDTACTPGRPATRSCKRS